MAVLLPGADVQLQPREADGASYLSHETLFYSSRSSFSLALGHVPYLPVPVFDLIDVRMGLWSAALRGKFLLLGRVTC